MTGREAVQVTTGDRTEAEYNRLWTTNVIGTFFITKRLAPLMNKGAPTLLFVFLTCSDEHASMPLSARLRAPLSRSQQGSTRNSGDQPHVACYDT